MIDVFRVIGNDLMVVCWWLNCDSKAIKAISRMQVTRMVHGKEKEK